MVSYLQHSSTGNTGKHKKIGSKKSLGIVFAFIMIFLLVVFNAKKITNKVVLATQHKYTENCLSLQIRV